MALTRVPLFNSKHEELVFINGLLWMSRQWWKSPRSPSAVVSSFPHNIWVKPLPASHLVSEKKTIVGTRNPSCFTDSGKSALWHLQSASTAETNNPTQCQLGFVSAASQPINCTSLFPRLQPDELNLRLRIWPLQISRAFARSRACIVGSEMAPFHMTDDGNFLV